MFDARSILDILVGGGGGPRRQSRPIDPTVFKDMLDQLGDQDSPPAAGRTATPANPQPSPGGHWTEQRYPPQESPQSAPGQQPTLPGGGSLEEILRNILGQIQQGGAPGGSQPSAPGNQPTPSGGPEVSQDLQDLLRQILQGGRGGGVKIPVNKLIGEAEAGGPEKGSGEGTSLAETLRQVLGQAAQGAREGAARIDEATGISGKARDALSEATGQSPEEMVARLKELISQNQLAAGAALGGLGALVLGTRAGRSLASTAIKLGGLGLIGGLAYKAFQNYQQGQPPISAGGNPAGDTSKPQTLLPAPDGSGFEAGAITHDAARRYLRAMIAAAAADGRIDAEEQQRLVGGLQQSGLDDPAQQFLSAEIASPATVAELASGITSPEEALQVYTAARIAVDSDTPEEHAFLSALADALGINPGLVAQVDATARGEAA